MSPFDYDSQRGNSLLARWYWDCDSGVCRRRSSHWYDWGRWIVLGIIVLFALVVFMSCGCIARRRRRRGAQPVYGTGWMAPSGKPNGAHPNNYGAPPPPPQDYNQGYNQGGGYGVASPPPAYGPQQQQPQYTGTTGTNFSPNDGYYGGATHQPQYGGVQPPQNAYHGDSTYAPPPGPPPGK